MLTEKEEISQYMKMQLIEREKRRREHKSKVVPEKITISKHEFDATCVVEMHFMARGFPAMTIGRYIYIYDNMRNDPDSDKINLEYSGVYNSGGVWMVDPDYYHPKVVSFHVPHAAEDARVEVIPVEHIHFRWWEDRFDCAVCGVTKNTSERGGYGNTCRECRSQGLGWNHIPAHTEDCVPCKVRKGSLPKVAS